MMLQHYNIFNQGSASLNCTWIQSFLICASKIWHVHKHSSAHCLSNWLHPDKHSTTCFPFEFRTHFIWWSPQWIILVSPFKTNGIWSNVIGWHTHIKPCFAGLSKLNLGLFCKGPSIGKERACHPSGNPWTSAPSSARSITGGMAAEDDALDILQLLPGLHYRLSVCTCLWFVTCTTI